MTSNFSSINFSAKCEPINPATPVTTTLSNNLVLHNYFITDRFTNQTFENHLTDFLI